MSHVPRPGRRVFLALGSNLGDREQNLNGAIDAIEGEHISVIARSSIYETEPQGVADQPWFLNMVIECETRHFPLQLLTILLRLERELGRVREKSRRDQPRLIDIDLLLFGNVVMETPRLTVPHPRMLERRFVLEPLVEIAPALMHPKTKQSFAKILGQLSRQKVRKWTAERN